MDLLRRIGGWGWLAIALAGGLLVLVWHDYASDQGDPSWTDPHQPPTMVPLAIGTSDGRTTRDTPYCRDYPGSLTGWQDCVVGAHVTIGGEL